MGSFYILGVEVPLNTLTNYLDTLLEAKSYQDFAYNGLQVDAGNSNIKVIAFAVDAGLSVIEQAASLKADLLIVHHGLLWGGEQPITGSFGTKIRALMSARCSLYASHLPLDGNTELGNATGLAKFFGAKDLLPFCEYKGRTIGMRASLPTPTSLNDLKKLSRKFIGSLAEPLLLPFGTQQITSLGIVTGSGSSAIELCKESGIDLLISGEPKQEAYHRAKEARQSCLFVGHYASETFGVSALQSVLKDKFRVETHFIDEPTGI